MKNPEIIFEIRKDISFLKVFDKTIIYRLLRVLINNRKNVYKAVVLSLRHISKDT